MRLIRVSDLDFGLGGWNPVPGYELVALFTHCRIIVWQAGAYRSAPLEAPKLRRVATQKREDVVKRRGRPGIFVPGHHGKVRHVPTSMLRFVQRNLTTRLPATATAKAPRLQRLPELDCAPWGSCCVG